MTSPAPETPHRLSSVGDLDILYKGFADATRIRILNALAAGELCVCDVVALLGVPQPTISRHLAYLRRAGLVRARRGWKFAYYRLAVPSHPVHRNLINCVRTCFAGIPNLDQERRAAASRVRDRKAEVCDTGPPTEAS